MRAAKQSTHGPDPREVTPGWPHDLAELCATLEAQAREDAVTGVDGQVAGIATAFDAARRALHPDG